jgi:hypothetical protein
MEGGESFPGAFAGWDAPGIPAMEATGLAVAELLPSAAFLGAPMISDPGRFDSKLGAPSRFARFVDGEFEPRLGFGTDSTKASVPEGRDEPSGPRPVPVDGGLLPDDPGG